MIQVWNILLITLRGRLFREVTTAIYLFINITDFVQNDGVSCRTHREQYRRGRGQRGGPWRSARPSWRRKYWVSTTGDRAFEAATSRRETETVRQNHCSGSVLILILIWPPPPLFGTEIQCYHVLTTQCNCQQNWWKFKTMKAR